MAKQKDYEKMKNAFNIKGDHSLGKAFGNNHIHYLKTKWRNLNKNDRFRWIKETENGERIRERSEERWEDLKLHRKENRREKVDENSSKGENQRRKEDIESWQTLKKAR